MIIGIDAGTTRFKSAILTSSGEPQILTNRIGEIFTPSVIYFTEEGTLLIGTEAANAALSNPERAVFDWKVNMGTNTVLYTDENGKKYKAQDILTIFLANVKADAEAKTGEPVNEAVITVPANYDNEQKRKTIEAATKAGMKVTVTPHEPTAGALGNQIYKLKNATVLVYDLGGGTFDVSIIKIKSNACEVIATGGIQKLGGRDFNNRIIEKALDEFEAQYNYRPAPDECGIFYQDLKSRVEQVKISLSAQTQCNIVASCNCDVLNMTVMRDQFEEWVSDLVEQTIEQTGKTLKEAGLGWADMDAIYPIGGGAMVPVIIRKLEKVSGKIVTQNCEAHCAAALGAVIAGRMDSEQQGKTCKVGSVTLPPINYYMRDILSRAIGVLVLNEDEQQVCCEILTKDTPIPSIQTRNFKLTELGQTNIRVQIMQGEEGAKADDCLSMGLFDLKDLPQRSDIVSRIEITFDLDSNGLLTASARDIVSNKKAELQVDYNNTQSN